MERKPIITKFNIKNKSVYAMLEWKQNDTDLFHIKLYDDNCCWAGRLSNEFVKTFSEKAAESEEEYRKNVKTCLTKTDSDEFVYELTPINGNQDAKFTWKKKFDDAIRTLGSVPVHQHSDTKDALIDMLLLDNTELQKSIEKYEQNVQKLASELDQSKVDLYKFIEAKTTMENSVYGKFVQLLNNKKRRIQLLEQNIQGLETANGGEVD